MNKPPKIAVLFMGKPGAGKGTQAEILVEKYGLTHFNTGEIIRHRLANPETDQDKKEMEIYQSGVLNSPEWVAGLVTETAHRYATEDKGIVFSGSPRTLYEAERLIPQLIADYGKDKVIAIYLDIDDHHAVSRNSGRLTCDGCGFTTTVPAGELQAKIGTVCPKCGGKFIQRAIDTAEKIIEKRLPEFMGRTLPTIELMRKEGIVSELDGRGSVAEVAQKVAAVVDPIAKKILNQ